MQDFNAYAFPVENKTDETVKLETVEGTYYYYYYIQQEGTKDISELQTFRNFENAIKAAGGTIVAKVVELNNSYSFITAKFKKGNTETWVKVSASTREYSLYIVERKLMEQTIEANFILDEIINKGFIALDIHFDFGKSTVKPESMPIIEELYTLLKTNPDLKVSIEGHTDNVGNAASNQALSEQRAQSVMNLLIAKGISKDRLSFKGWGQNNPVADNRTEEGKAKNRRVEIVKK
jgi:outer membrane protein OmpA-like peptidoglycan-associated protein